MAEKKNQHFVPKVHLKNFSTDSQKRQVNIWIPKLDKLVFGASIRDQCSKSYLYGKDLRIEEFFNTPEGMFGDVVNKLTESQTPAKEDLDKLLFLWLLQHLRAEKAIKDRLLMMSSMREKVALGQKENDELEDFLGPPMEGPEAMEMVLDSARVFFDTISDLRCVLLVNKSKTGFVMSDNPAVSSNKLVLKRYMKYRNWGLGGAGLYVYLPLTPKLGFFAFDRHVYELNGREGMTCKLKEKDAIALNQLVYLFSNDVVVLSPYGDTTQTVEALKEVENSKPESTLRVNIAVEDEEQKFEGSKRFSVATDEEFAASTKGGLIHVESVPPIVPRHLPKLRIRQRPRFIDTMSGAGLRRYGGIQPS
ncbi:DUF4238 domain-containing protein [Pelagibius marinus]|uniref:DUF4238 domain-containing protein n=1 Tax=Pelagibius marinus TaxID=2762760 RepID=UPI001872CC23|nr:DUF4238 domain-containing protein [Pelagibius marinus]